MKIKNDINIGYFHTAYLLDGNEQLHPNRAISERCYSKIIRAFFDFIKQKLYEGNYFISPIGTFKIVKVIINTKPDKKLVSHAASKIEQRVVYRSKEKNYFHKLHFQPLNGLEDRYVFKGLQRFVRQIYKYYD